MNQKTISEPSCLVNGFMPLQPIWIGGFSVLPWGSDNCYPNMIMQITMENGMVAQILNKHFELLWGQGPQLYRTDFIAGKRVKRWIQDKEVESWLKSWNYLEYLEKITVEFLMLNGCCSISHASGNTIEKLEFISCDHARLQWPGIDAPIISMITGDFTDPILSEFDRLPMFDPDDPFAHHRSICFEALYQAGVEYYPRSPIHSSLSWITVGSKSADLVTAFNANSISPKYHIEAPALYWERFQEKLISECLANGTEFTEALFRKAKDKTFEDVSTALSGIDKVGKFLVTELMHDEKSNEYVGWKVTIIETRVRDYLAAHLKIAHESLYNVSAGMGMHPALTGMRKSGGLSTGSEFEYAAKIYKQVQTEFAERYIMKNLNAAIAINYQGLRTKIGFNHDEI